MNSSQMKMCVLCWFRFKKRWNYVATEVGGFNADVVGANSQYLYEVEVKVNKRDFTADFQKSKHEIYKNHDSVSSWGKGWIPNKFFFAVPEDMVDFALEQLKDYDKYGLVTVSWKDWWRNPQIKTIKQAKFMHKRPTSKKALDLILLRMSSEICGHYIKNEAERNKTSAINKIVEKLCKGGKVCLKK